MHSKYSSMSVDKCIYLAYNPYQERERFCHPESSQVPFIHSLSFPANKSRVTSITRDRFACCRTSHRWDNQTCSLLHLSLSMFLRFVHARFVHH